MLPASNLRSPKTVEELCGGRERCTAGLLVKFAPVERGSIVTVYSVVGGPIHLLHERPRLLVEPEASPVMFGVQS